MNKRVWVASWLFLFGSGLFMLEAIAELIHHVSLAAMIHLAEGTLFSIGSFFFIPKIEPKL